MYPNGEFPDSALITFAEGVDEDGPWKHQFTPATLARHNTLLARAFARTGRWLALSPGWSAYRPLFAQRIYRDRYGFGAAVPRFSSHGGYWEDQQTMAGDYGNWAWVYEKFADPRAEFYADCRAVGLTPGLIHPSRGNNYPDEPWHVIDLNPFTMPEYPEEVPELILEEAPVLIKANVNIYSISPGQIVLCNSTRQVANGQKAGIHRYNLTGSVSEQNQAFVDLLDLHGIPRSVIDNRGYVLNPETGRHENNGTWSQSRAVLAARKS